MQTPNVALEDAHVVPLAAPPVAQNTLDEPVWQTIWRDVKRVGFKLAHVLVPRPGDLWGPLIFCLMLALYVRALLSPRALAHIHPRLLGENAPTVFVVVWVGAAAVTINSLLLGGKVSFFQAVCLLGYCIFPLVVSAFVIMMTSIWWTNVWYRLGIALGGFLWGTIASVGFLAGMVPPDRKALAVYPVLLLYLVIAWLVVMHYSQ